MCTGYECVNCNTGKFDQRIKKSTKSNQFDREARDKTTTTINARKTISA